MQRCLGEVETCHQFLASDLAGQRVRRSIRSGIDFAHRHVRLGVHDLYRLIQPDPVETGSQYLMPLDDRSPRANERFNFEARDGQTDLVDVEVIAAVLDRMEQHALLCRRQWVHVRDPGDRNRQRVQLRLGERTQREVGWGGPCDTWQLAVFDQRLELLLKRVGQPLNGGLAKKPCAEGPVDTQPLRPYPGIDRQAITA
ncbi:hypothetical protein D3C76_960630 [compost metagenome]